MSDEAVVVWTGYPEADVPKRDDELVRQRFGAAEADRLLPVIRDIENECWASNAHKTSADLPEMATAAAAHLCKRFPQLAGDAIDALVWVLHLRQQVGACRPAVVWERRLSG